MLRQEPTTAAVVQERERREVREVDPAMEDEPRFKAAIGEQDGSQQAARIASRRHGGILPLHIAGTRRPTRCFAQRVDRVEDPRL